MSVTGNEESLAGSVSRDTRYGAWDSLEDNGRTYAAAYTADGFSLDMLLHSSNNENTSYLACDRRRFVCSSARPPPIVFRCLKVPISRTNEQFPD